MFVCLSVGTSVRLLLYLSVRTFVSLSSPQFIHLLSEHFFFFNFFFSSLVLEYFSLNRGLVIETKRILVSVLVSLLRLKHFSFGLDLVIAVLSFSVLVSVSTSWSREVSVSSMRFRHFRS